MVVSAKSLLAPTFDCNLIPGFFIPKDIYGHGAAGAEELWRVFVHGLNSAFDGRHYSKDVNDNPWPHGSPQYNLQGLPLCGGRVRIVIWVVTGDLEFLGNELRMPHFNSQAPCWLCPVHRMIGSLYPITDCRKDAPWKYQLFPDDDTSPFTQGHPVGDIKGITRFHIPGDLMHSGDLGICAYLVGSVMTELVFAGPWHGSLAERLNSLWSEIRVVYAVRDSKNRLSNLTLTMFYHGDERAAVFTGKAAECRSLLYVIRDICMTIPTHTTVDQSRLRCLQLFCEIYDCCFQHGLHIPHEDAVHMLHNYDEFLLHYNLLCKDALARGFLCYSIVTKLHMMWHIVFHARWLNPRFIWAYEFEDFVGAIINTAKACMAGTPLRLVGPKVMQNFLLVLNLRLNR